ALPEDFSRIAVETEHLKRLSPVARHAVRMHPGFALSDMMRRMRAGDDFALKAGGKKNSVVPDDRRRMPATGKFGFPENVLIDAPFGRQVLLFRNAPALQPAP